MKRNKKLEIAHLDQKIQQMTGGKDTQVPEWVRSVRKSLNMSLQQLGARIGVTPQSVVDIEKSEKAGTISIKTLQKVGNALNLKLVYGFLPNDGSFEKLVEKQALIAARKIIERTNATMTLENQQVSKDRLEKSIRELALEIQNEMPSYLWD